jgi:hypothetical protein
MRMSYLLTALCFLLLASIGVLPTGQNLSNASLRREMPANFNGRVNDESAHVESFLHPSFSQGSQQKTYNENKVKALYVSTTLGFGAVPSRYY